MSQRLRRTLVIVISVALVLCILAASTAIWLPRRSFAKVDGRIQLTGLDSPVDVYRDSFGIPYIYAQSAHDLFFAQGYVHAQDRFWQMDFWRHLGSARLSEMFGSDQLDADRFLRTLGWARVAQQEWEALDADTRQALQAYADGVNAYLADHWGTALSLEYAVLKLLTPSYQPEPWQPLHSLTWGKAMAWNLGDNMSMEIQRALLLKTLTPQQLAEIDPPYPSDHPVIVPNFQLAGTTADQQETGRAALASLAPGAICE